MTKFYEIPLSATPQKFTVSLSGVEYQMRLTYASFMQDKTVIDAPRLARGIYPNYSAENIASFSRDSSASFVENGVVKFAEKNAPRYQDGGLLIEAAANNLLTYSEQMWNTSFWVVGTPLANFYAATNSADIQNIYGGIDGVAKFVANASTAVLFLRKTVTLLAGTYAPSIWIYVPSQAGVTRWQLQVDAADVEATAATGSITSFDRWVRVQIPALTTNASRAWFDFNIIVNGAQPLPGFTFYAMAAQMESGASATSYIPTTSAPSARSADLCAIGHVEQENSQGGWILDISSKQGAPIVQGIPLVTGANLLEQYGHLGFVGRLWVQGSPDPNVVPTFANLGTGAFLFWVTD